MDTPLLTIPASTLSKKILEIVPEDIQLFPHQIDCVGWLLERETTNNIRCNLLGDIMGLGKTRSTVTLLSLNPLKRTIIVCPKSLICQWSRELIYQHHIVYFMTSQYAHKVTVYNNKVIIHKEEITHKKLPRVFVAITSYGKIKPFPEPKHDEETAMTVFESVKEGFEDDTDACLTPFRRIIWDRIVVDEIHNLRNGVSLTKDKSSQLRKKSLRFYRMSRLRKRSNTIVFGLTGTPLQNRIGDLASIFLFLGCTITRLTDTSQLKELVKANLFRRNVSNLTGLTKALISFPTEPYNETKVTVEYETEEEKNFYIAATGNLSQKLQSLLDGYEKLVAEDNILTVLTLLRLLSSHPMAFINCYNKRYEDQIPKWKGSVSKYNMLEAQLMNYQSNRESCIVFVHFYEEASRIGELNHGYDIVEYIHGSVNSSDRDYIVQDSKNVIEGGGTYLIIANIIACGEGLNLQHFHNVIISSVDYNPAAEEQAIGRVYRIGSTRRVNVTRYYHKEIEDLREFHNIDKFMKQKQDKKKKIAEELIDNTPNAAWFHPISMIPTYNMPCTQFPLIIETKEVAVRVSITRPPGRNNATSLPQDRRERARMIEEATRNRLNEK